MRSMSVKSMAILVLCFGVVGLVVPLFLPPAPVLPDWSAFIPYILLGITLSLTKARATLRFLLVVAVVVVGGGTWVYWDSMRFNRVISWQAFGLVSRYVPLFQTALALPVCAFVCWQQHRPRCGVTR